MASVAFNRAIAGMGTPHKQGGDAVSTEAAAETAEIDPNESVIVLTDEIQAVRMHQLAISLRPLPGGSSGRPMLTASRWEVRKAIMSLCCTPPTMFEIEATDKSASIRVAFSGRAAAEDLSLKLRGTTVKIKGVKLHAFVREVSESAALSEGEDWAGSLPGSKVLSATNGGSESESDSAREAAFGRLEPGKRPDTIVLRGVPANWLGVGGKGKAAEGTDAPGLELMMSRLGPVRAVEVMPSAPHDRDLDPADGGSSSAASAPKSGSASAGPRHNHRTKNGRTAAAAAAAAATGDFDVNALLSNMPKPRALAKGGGGRGAGGGQVSAAGRSGSASRGGVGVGVGVGGGGGGGGVGEALSVGLHVDAWVQFASFRGFRRALSALRGRTLKKAGAELLCEYRLGVDVTGFMTEERRRVRVAARAKKAQEDERRKASIEKARGQLALLREGLQSLRDAVEEDGRPALEDAVKPTIQKVTEHVERAEALLGVRHNAFVDEPAATAAVSTARGEIAIARLSIRKARAAVDRAEEEERKRIEREKDQALRDAAGVTLKELEESLSQGLALVSSEREHPGIKPQADTAIGFLDKLSDACSREGGGSEAFGAEGEGGGGLVADARRATEKAITRACMLQRYLDTSARLEALKAKVGAALLPPPPPLEAGGGGNGSGGDTTSTAAKAQNPTGGGGILSAQVDVADAVLSRELQGLSEGDLLLIWERAEEALGVADGMLETLTLVERARHRLADAKAAVAGGDPVLRTSEGIMRLIAAAAMSTARAQREGAAAAGDVVAPEALKLAAERWRRAAVSADSDVAAAAQEVERVSGELQDKRQREEQERAWRKAEEERRLREEEAHRLERQARAAEREALERRQAEARIFAMELRRNEMTKQVRNKAARKRLQEHFRAQRAASGASGGRGGKKVSSGSEHAEPPPIADRWTLEEGLAEETNPTNGSGAPNPTSAPPPAAATAEPTSADKGSRNGEANAPPAAEGGDPSSAAAAAAAAVLPPGEDRWAMNDGAADLAERGVELEMGGVGLPSPPSLLSSSSPPFLLGAVGGGGGGRRRGRKRNRQEEWTEEAEAEWLELVSKRVRSSVVGGAEAGSWGAEASVEEGDAAVGGGGGASQPSNGVDPAGAAAAAGAAKGKGGDVEAKLRQRLLAAMMGKSKAKAKPKVDQ